MFAGKKSAQIREILISESAWEEMTCLFAPSLEQLIATLHANPQQRWSVADMASMMQCSEPWLRRLFLRYTGKTPKEYYLDAQLNLAQSLLKQEGNSVSQVAGMLNFFDSFHFSKAFKRKFGYSPSAVLKIGDRHPVDAGQEG